MKKNGKIINTILLAAFAAIIAVTSLTSQNIGLNTTVSASSARVRVNATRYVNVPNGSTLNLRSGAGMGHTVIGSIPRGTALHIPYAEGNWAYTSYNGKYGWVSLDYISVSKPSTTPTLPTP
ncbi:MAG: SH3 domain-containing protein, partial [Oscillospiraceae bacterium]|nr:SH3 domain-containing protein [Oscillospiraceae bacterium]